MKRLLAALLVILGATSALAQNVTTLSPVAVQQFFTPNGIPCAGCALFTYAAGTNTKVNTFTDSTGATPQTNPIILSSAGWATSFGIWLTPGQAYKFVLAPAGSSDPPTNPTWTVDGIVAIAGQSTALVLSQVLTNAALQAACTQTAGCPPNAAVFPNGVWRQSFYASGIVAASPAPPLFYTPQTGTCAANSLTADNGYCVNDASGNSWIGLIESEADPREWGAVHNATRYTAAATISSSTNAVATTGACAAPANIGQNVVIYDFTDLPLQGTIISGTTTSQIVLSVTPSFSFVGNVAIICGSDDSTPINSALSYVNNISTIHRPVNLGGFKYGVLNPIVMGGGVDLTNGYIQVLGQGSFVPDPYSASVNGAITVTKNNTNIFHIWIDAADLPVNCYDIEAAGQIRLGPTVNCQHWGQKYSQIVTTGFTMPISDTFGHPNYQATVTSTAGLTTGMFTHSPGVVGSLPDNTGIVQVVDGTHLILSTPPTGNTLAGVQAIFYKDGNCLMVGAQHTAALIGEDINCQQFIVTDPSSAATNSLIRGGASLYWGQGAGASVILASILQYGSVPIYQDTSGSNLEVDGTFLFGGNNVSMTNNACYMNAVLSANTTLSMFSNTMSDCVFDYFVLNNKFMGMNLTGFKYQTGANAPHLPYNQIFTFVTNQSASPLSPNFYTIQPPYSYSGGFQPIALIDSASGFWSSSAQMLAGAVNNQPKGNSLFPIGRAVSMAPFTFTATTDGSTGILTAVSGVTWANLSLGQGIAGTGIPANSYIVAFNQTADIIDISANTTSANVGETVTDSPLNTAFQSPDSGCVYNYANGSTAVDIPVPAILPPGWTCDIFVNGTGTVTAHPLGAGTINGAGSNFVFSQNTLYHMTVSNTGNLNIK